MTLREAYRLGAAYERCDEKVKRRIRGVVYAQSYRVQEAWFMGRSRARRGL